MQVEDDEINTQAGDILASPEEIKAAIEVCIVMYLL